MVTDPQNTNTHRHKQANKQNKQTNKQRNPQTGPLSLARSVINSISAMGYIISSCKNGCRLNSIKNHLWCVLLDTSQHSFKAFCIVCIADQEPAPTGTHQQNVKRSLSTLYISTDETRSSADADNGLDAFSSQSRSTNMVPFWVHCDFSLSM